MERFSRLWGSRMRCCWRRLAFPLEFIPMIGPLTASIVILVAPGFSSYPHGWALAAFLGAYGIFQDYVLSPHLMSSGMELHPLLVVFGVFAGSFCILDEGCAARRAQHRAADAAGDVAQDTVHSHHPFQG